MLLFALIPAAAGAQQVEVLLPEKECQVKYALLYSFGLLTTWPAGAFEGAGNRPFVIGVLGDKPFPEYLDRIAANKKIQNRTIVIRRCKTADEIGSCHILYITSAVARDVEQAVLRKLAKEPVLMVGEHSPGPGDAQTVIQFIIEQGAVKFLLDAEAAKAHDLQIDPRLLTLRKQPSEPKP